MRRSVCIGLFVSVAYAAVAPGVAAQGTTQSADDPAARFRLPPITVTAQKEPESIEEVPVSVTAVTDATLQAAGIRSVSEAAQYAANVFVSEFTARKVSNPSIRGVGASPTNPGVTTYIDGVPQLNANSSSIELAGVNQIEFVRGPQSALFGRNALGGIINITSTRPSLKNWTGGLEVPFGNYKYGDVRGSVSGPVAGDSVALGVAAGYSGRQGFTTNDVTGHDLDSRSATFGKVQLLMTPASGWEIRGLVTAERARDGDYALNDLGALRATPFHVSRDFEGYTHRDLVAPTAIVSYRGPQMTMTSTTGFVSWNTDDLTDLDYTAAPLLKRSNAEKDHQFTEEVRFASPASTRLNLSNGVDLRWQAGLFLFTQDYSQDAVNSYSPFVLSPFITFPVEQRSPQSELDDNGFGIYGAATLAFNRRVDATIGMRADHEHKTGDLNTSFTPAIAPPSTVSSARDFNDVSPQFTVAYHATPTRMLYGTASRGFKAGGFNPASPGGSEAYGEEHSWNYEGGVKTSWMDNRIAINGAFFFLDWTDLQVNVPNPQVPAQFYIANAGSATSTGFEAEMTARAAPGIDVFGSLGYTRATFGDEGVSGGVSVAGNRRSDTPDFTLNAGIQYSRALTTAASLFARGEFVTYGHFYYDDANSAGQDAYTLANFRGGIRGKVLSVEGWVRNAFNTAYIPIALPYPGLAPSGFIGESGSARTFGVRAGVSF